MSESLHLLLSSAIDYAGLFPPAELDMATAAACYDRYRRSEHAWMLGTFVAPVSRLGELAAFASRGGGAWPVTALLGSKIADDIAAIDHFQQTGTGRVEWIEVKVASSEEIRAVRDRVPKRFGICFEFSDLQLMKVVRAVSGRAKIRTGGVTPDAIPTPDDVARFLACAASCDVPVKATAGLHHPIRAEHALTYKEDAPRAPMHGFMNVLLASVFVRAGVGAEELVELLEERSLAVFGFEADGVTWRYHRITNQQIRRAREYSLVSFGSCSFEEPVEDLRAAGLL